MQVQLDGGNHRRGAEGRPLEGEHRGPDGELEPEPGSVGSGRPAHLHLAPVPQSCVIVNTISENMNLTQGAVSKAILKEAGSGLQSAVRSTSRTPTLDHGSVIITDGFKLKCQKVFHAVCPPWTGASHEEKVRRCSVDPWFLCSSHLSSSCPRL